MNRLKNASDIFNTSIITIRMDEECTPETLTVNQIKAAFATKGGHEHDAFLRQALYEMYHKQANRHNGSQNEEDYNRLIHGLDARTIATIEQLEPGMQTEPFYSIRSAFLNTLNQDQAAIRAQKPEAATLREQGQAFTPSLVAIG